MLRAASTWKMKTALGSPSPSKVMVPVRATAAAVWCTPARKVRPIRSPENSVCATRLSGVVVGEGEIGLHLGGRGVAEVGGPPDAAEEEPEPG